MERHGKPKIVTFFALERLLDRAGRRPRQSRQCNARSRRSTSEFINDPRLDSAVECDVHRADERSRDALPLQTHGRA